MLLIKSIHQAAIVSQRQFKTYTKLLSRQSVINPFVEPPYLEALRPKVGYYNLVNLTIRGYDFALLEKYQSYVHKTLKRLDFKVTKSWASPYQELQLESLAHASSVVESVTRVKVYERNLQMKNALVTHLSLLIDILTMTTPKGVTFSLEEHNPSFDDKIYFKDSILEGLYAELEELKNTTLIGE